jgi:4-amino-4-deoxy-L-arabinose transferase-like glycosyltransferase
VTRTDNSTLDSHSSFSVAHVAWIVLILATLYICYFHNLGAIGLVGPDEPRYAWIARDMAETGDWVTPRLYGKPWFEKPVLYYWAAALSFKLFGVSEITARLPSALAALFATLSMAWLAWRTYGAETARWLLLLLPTTVGMIGFSHAAATDMPFAAMLTIAMVFAAIILGLVRDQNSPILPRTPWLALLLFGFFLGLAVLAKGPAAIILSGGAILLWAIFTKRWRDAFRCLHPVAIVSFCLTALPWYILCVRRNPDFFRIFIIEHNFKRFLTPEFQHIQPFWFYIPVILVAFIPWTVVILWSAFQGFYVWLKVRQFSPLVFFLLTWAGFCFLFFSASHSKLPGYILPALPPLGFLVTRAHARIADSSLRTPRWLLCAIALITLAASLVIWSLPFSLSRINAHAATGAGWLLSLLAIANFILAIAPGKKFSGFLVPQMCVLPVLLLTIFFRPLAADLLPRDPSGKSLALELQKLGPLPESLGVKYYVARMARGQQFSLSFYLHREIQAWDSEYPNDGFVIFPSADCLPPITPPWSCSRNSYELGSTGFFMHRVHKKNSAAEYTPIKP